MTLPKKISHLSWKKLGESTLILDSLETNSAHQLDEIGSIIWNSCDGITTKETLVQLILYEYEIDRETLINDIDLFLLNLHEKKLVIHED